MKLTDTLSTIKITIIGILIILISIGITIFDCKIIQPRAYFTINNYSSIITTIWSIQATLSTLTIAFISIFTNKLNESHYGLSIKELLAIKKDFVGINFFEKILLIMILTAVTIIPVIFDCMNATILLAIIEFIMIFQIIETSLKVTMYDEYANSIAKKKVDKLLRDVLDEKIDDSQLETRKLTKKQEKLYSIISKIIEELNTKSDSNDISLSTNDKSFLFIIKVMRECKESYSSVYKECSSEVVSWFNDMIKSKRYINAIDLGKWMIYDADNGDSQYIARVICHEYYSGRLDREYFEIFINEIKFNTKQKLEKYFDIALEIMFQILQNADEHYFKAILSNIMQCQANYKSHKRMDFLQITAAYTYYLCLKEKLYEGEFGEKNLKILQGIITSEFIANGKKQKLSSIISNENYLLGINKCLSLIKRQSGKIHYRDLYILGQLRTVHVDRDIQEYAIFILFTIYKNNNNSLNQLPYDFLVLLRKHLTSEGNIVKFYQDNYQKFAVWLDWKPIKQNPTLLSHVEILLKTKIIERSKLYREDSSTIEEKIATLGMDIKEIWNQSPFITTNSTEKAKRCFNYFNAYFKILLKIKLIKKIIRECYTLVILSKKISGLWTNITEILQNEICINTDTNEQVKKCSFSSIECIGNYSKNVSYFGFDTFVFNQIQSDLFYKNEKNLSKLNININDWEDYKKNEMLIESLEKSKKDIQFNLVFNENIVNYLAYGQTDNCILDRIKNIDSDIIISEFNWDIGQYAMVYINDKIFKPRIIIEDSFIKTTMYLTDNEIEEYVKEQCFKDDKYFIKIDQDLSISSTHDECFAYIKELKFKITFEYEIIISDKEFGVVVLINSDID